MNIDERLEALSRNLEQLASLHNDHEQRMPQALETLTALHIENGKRIDQSDRTVDTMATNMGTLATNMDTLATNMDRLATSLDRLTGRTIQAMDAISTLSRIVANHEDRLEDLEGKS